MGTYLVQRLCLMLLTLFGITLLVFAILRLVPGGVDAAILGDQATPDQYAQVRHQLDLDRPIVVQYLTWAGHALRGSG